MNYIQYTIDIIAEYKCINDLDDAHWHENDTFASIMNNLQANNCKILEYTLPELNTNNETQYYLNFQPLNYEPVKLIITIVNLQQSNNIANNYWQYKFNKYILNNRPLQRDVVLEMYYITQELVKGNYNVIKSI